ncbi:phosphatase PAP2 family protein [Enterococcus gallinarum]|nr:phosphatase PAP2 family protein [Enterococcus gallinarum]
MVSYFFIFGSTWYAATTRGGTGFICYQEPNTCFNTDDALFTNFGKALPTIILLLLLYVFPATQTILAPKAAASVLLVSAFAYLIKRIVRRERPNDHRLVEEKDHSFPSAHAATSAALYGTAAMNMAFLLPPAVLPMSILAVLLSFMIGLSRVYLGIHFLTDVIGGWFLGLAVAALITILL